MKGFIKNFNNIFKPYKNPYLSLHDRFTEDKSVQWVNDYNEFIKNNKGSFRDFLSYIKLQGLYPLNLLENGIINFISLYTNNEITEETITDFVSDMKKCFPKELKDITITDNNAVIKLKNRDIKIFKLSDYFPEFAKDVPEILTSARNKQCHFLSSRLVMGLEDRGFVVTGPTYKTSPKERFLHSWVEFEENKDKIVCCDPTFNVVMKKEDYYYLFHARPYEKISKSQLIDDEKSLRKLLGKDDIYLKLYLSSREEALDIASKMAESNESELTQ